MTTSLSDRVLSDRVLPDRVLPDRVLSDRVLPDRVLPDRVLPDRVLPDRVSVYVNVWNRLKPDVLVDNVPCLADNLRWTFRAIPEGVEARCSWKYVHDPWEEMGTSLRHFSLFLETMGKWMRIYTNTDCPPRIGYRSHLGSMEVVQLFLTTNASDREETRVPDRPLKWKWDGVFMNCIDPSIERRPSYSEYLGDHLSFVVMQ